MPSKGIYSHAVNIWWLLGTHYQETCLQAKFMWDIIMKSVCMHIRSKLQHTNSSFIAQFHSASCKVLSSIYNYFWVFLTSSLILLPIYHYAPNRIHAAHVGSCEVYFTQNAASCLHTCEHFNLSFGRCPLVRIIDLPCNYVITDNIRGEGLLVEGWIGDNFSTF